MPTFTLICSVAYVALFVVGILCSLFPSKEFKGKPVEPIEQTILGKTVWTIISIFFLVMAIWNHRLQPEGINWKAVMSFLSYICFVASLWSIWITNPTIRRA